MNDVDKVKKISELMNHFDMTAFGELLDLYYRDASITRNVDSDIISDFKGWLLYYINL